MANPSPYPNRNPNYKPFPKSNRQLAMIRRVKADNSTAIQAKLKRLEGLVGKRLPKVVEEANKLALVQIQLLARKNLEDSLKASRQAQRSGDLEKAIVDDRYSIADARRIQFFRDELIRPVLPYYRAVEHGDDSQVGQKRPFEFLGRKDGAGRGPINTFRHQQAPDISRVDRTIGPRERLQYDRFTNRKIGRHGSSFTGRITKNPQRGIYTVTIKNPVPAYHYAEHAAEQFRRKNGYNTALNTAIRSSGLEREGIKFVLSGR